MKKIILLVPLIGLFLISSAFADGIGVKVPSSQMGPEASVNYAGVKGKIITAETETLISSNSCVLYGIFVTSVTSGSPYVIFRDTDTTNATGTQTVSTFYMDVSTKSWTLPLTYPIRFAKGMTAILTKVVGNPASITVMYADME